ncbi:glycoside hydrolase [Chryseobacterium lactis]|uniref:Glycoside hydrolase n=1 Tax=Chryseobacterium lactis TaxID=1241981 RepID=A0A3G6REN0_CHRLC|nr:glycoside hydrolase [Chryseobacterium lactis]AZA83129.1 glycoside hydrolase [Chryseobacterium lactis]AZB03512.1 glycoside hydrolase [Chryseobacterium lactis]PNW11982.1 glycoside hydrolase [Chryseobacterium lactis]
MVVFKNNYISVRLWLVMFILCSCGTFKAKTIVAKDSTSTIITLNGPWKFKTGDHMEWTASDFDDSKWETVDLTAPVGAHDGDVGLSGYVSGWATRGYPRYSGYAWYRIKVSLEQVRGNVLALTGPPAIDDAYQLFVNGVLLGSAGDFSDPVPTAYSIQPRMFLLPANVRKEKWITIAFRVWMSEATLSQLPDAGGIHIAPELGDKSSIESKYRHQWGQTIKGYIVEVIEPILFILLAIMIFVLKPVKHYRWFIIALLLLALVRANQAFFYWFQWESAHEIDIVTTVILMPLVLGSWIIAWKDWYGLDRIDWITKIVAVLTLVYMSTQLLGLPWLFKSIPYSLFQKASEYIRLFFVLLMIYTLFRGIRQEGKKNLIYLPAALLLSIGLFSQEVSALHIQGIWFPYGVGVSRTQYVYAAFVIVMLLVLIYKKRSETKTV